MLIDDPLDAILARYAPAEPMPARARRRYSPRFAVAEWESFYPTFRIRRPAVSPLGLIPGDGIGDCLEPMLEGEGYALFDPAMRADDGDLVLIAWHPEFIERMIEHGRRDPTWTPPLNADGKFPRLAAKILRHGDGRLWITCRQYGFPLETTSRVLGVCRHLEIDGRPVYGSLTQRQRFMRAWALNIIRPWREHYHG